jgi:hypothetical protein
LLCRAGKGNPYPSIAQILSVNANWQDLSHYWMNQMEIPGCKKFFEEKQLSYQTLKDLVEKNLR